MAASKSGTVHSKTHRLCPISSTNIAPIGALSNTKPARYQSTCLESNTCPMEGLIYHEIKRATVPRKWLRPNHVRDIPRPTGSVLSIQEIWDPSVHYPVLNHLLESSPYPKASLIYHEWFKQLLYRDNWLSFNHVRYIAIPTGSVLSTQEILDPTAHYPVLNHHLQSSPHRKAGLIWQEWLKEPLHNGKPDIPWMIQRAILPW